MKSFLIHVQFALSIAAFSALISSRGQAGDAGFREHPIFWQSLGNEFIGNRIVIMPRLFLEGLIHSTEATLAFDSFALRT